MKRRFVQLFFYIGKFFPDKLYLSILYYIKTHSIINWKSPKTYTEKLQWLKIYDRKPFYTSLVDKVQVKEYVKNIIGLEYVIPTIAVWNSADEIEFEQLPSAFVLKCNHNSGSGICICRDKAKLNIEDTKKNLDRALKMNYYKLYREHPYKNVERKVFAEQLLVDDSCNDGVLTDYKFFCFNGKPLIMYVSKDKADHCTTDFFDMEYNRLPIRMRDPNSEILPQKPKEFEKMKELAEKLSNGFAHIRVDFYLVKHKIYFGELTFYHNSGFSLVQPPEWNLLLGSYIKIC